MPGFDTIATHSADLLGPVAEQPLSPPIWQVADYAYESAGHYADVINERRPGQVYGRYGSPTAQALAGVLARLEGAEAGWAFSSGMGATHAVLMHLAGAGDRLVCARTLYGGTYGLLTGGARRAGIEVVFADASDGEAVAAALGPGAGGVFVETVANPTLEVADLERIAAACRRAGVPLAVDNTVPTPVLANPIRNGADLVLHSTSKYVGGHHDLMGGAVVGPAPRIDDIRRLAIGYGTTASALESWLALRGLATLGLRVERHSASALTLARMLEASGKVARVHYPGLPSHPHHERASRLLAGSAGRGYGGMLSVDLGSEAAAWRFMDALEVARVGSSFGGVRSEVTHPATTSHRQFSPQDRAVAGITGGLVRVSVGLEDVSDLLDDAGRALEKL